MLVGIGDPSSRLADRDRDGLVCSATLGLFGRPVGRILTDNAIGDPTIFPPDPCTDPFRTVSVGDPKQFSWIRQIDLNGDGRICAGFVEPSPVGLRVRRTWRFKEIDCPPSQEGSCATVAVPGRGLFCYGTFC